MLRNVVTPAQKNPGTVFILSSEGPENTGGVEHFVRALGQGLEQRDLQVVFFHRGNSVPSWLPNPSNRWARYGCDALAGYFIGSAGRRRLGPEVTACISNGPLGWSFRHAPPTCKRIHMYHGTYWGQAEAIRQLITLMGYWKLKYWDARILEGWSGKGTLCLANSDQTREEVKAIFGLDATTIWLPLDTAIFRPLDQSVCRRALGLPESRIFGLFVGSFAPVKNPAVVRALVEGRSDVNWLLAVRGEIPACLRNRPGTRLFPNANREVLTLLYNAANFSICPSLYEAFGYVVAEAGACGTPVIASPGGASRLLLQEPALDQLLVRDANDVVGFETAIERVLAGGEQFRRLFSERVRPRIDRFLAPNNWWRRFSEVTGLCEK
jgi:glycosyltransferase involved in cell wall biosynthesis